MPSVADAGRPGLNRLSGNAVRESDLDVLSRITSTPTLRAARYVIKEGRLFIKDHEFCDDHEGRILHVAPDYDPSIEDVIRPFFDDYYTIVFDNYAVADSYLRHHEVIPTVGGS